MQHNSPNQNVTQCNFSTCVSSLIASPAPLHQCRANAISHIQSTLWLPLCNTSWLIATLSPCERSASAERALNFTMQFVDHRDKCSLCAVWSAASDYWRRRKELLTLLLKNRLARQVVWCRKSSALKRTPIWSIHSTDLFCALVRTSYLHPRNKILSHCWEQCGAQRRHSCSTLPFLSARSMWENKTRFMWSAFSWKMRKCVNRSDEENNDIKLEIV